MAEKHWAIDTTASPEALEDASRATFFNRPPLLASLVMRHGADRRSFRWTETQVPDTAIAAQLIGMPMALKRTRGDRTGAVVAMAIDKADGLTLGELWFARAPVDGFGKNPIENVLRTLAKVIVRELASGGARADLRKLKP